MERYKILKVVGDGAYGLVYKALNKSSGEIVAIKKIKKKFNTWDECMSLREIKSLRKLSHPNIIKLKEVIRSNNELHLIFEYIEQNIYQLTKNKSIDNQTIKSIIYQTLSGLLYMHKNGFFHRDMKPENILIQNDSLKIADFGLAREIRSKPPFTDYVSTRWYRAPEILLRSTSYNSPVDIFALGAIMAELYIGRPLFPGSNEHDQIAKVCSVLGTPSIEMWPEGYKLASKLGLSLPNFSPLDFQKVVPSAPPEAIDLMLKMMHFDPQKRFTAAECLEHEYFAEKLKIAANIRLNGPVIVRNKESREKSRRGFKALAPIHSFLNQPNDFSNDSLDNQRVFKKHPNVRQANPLLLNNTKEKSFVSDYGVHKLSNDIQTEQHPFLPINRGDRQLIAPLENKSLLHKDFNNNIHLQYENKYNIINDSELFFKPPYYKQKPAILREYKRLNQPAHISLPPCKQSKNNSFIQY